MISLKRWSTFFQGWRRIVEEKYNAKQVSYKQVWEEMKIEVKDGVSFVFNNEKKDFLDIDIENCSREEFQDLAAELLAFMKEKGIDLFVSIKHDRAGEYETEGDLEGWIPSGENALAVANIMKGIAYRKQSETEFGLLNSYQTLFQSSITLEFNIDKKSVLLMVNGAISGEKLCYEECYAAEEINVFVENCEKEKEQVEKLEEKIKELMGEDRDVYFDFARELENHSYELGFYIDETCKRVYMQEVDEAYIISLVLQAKKVKKEIKEIEKEMKKVLYQKDKYAYEYDRWVRLFKGENQIKMDVSFEEEPEIYKIRIYHKEYNKKIRRDEEKTEEVIIGTKEEAVQKATQLLGRLYNEKRLKLLFSSDYKSNHLKMMKTMLLGEDAHVVYDDEMKGQFEIIEKELENYFEENRKENIIPIVYLDHDGKEICLETVKFSWTKYNTIRLSKI